MVLLVSNKCDLMLNYSDWVFNRLTNGRISRPAKNGTEKAVDFTPQNVDCVVFKTRNPIPLLNKVSSLQYLNYKCVYDIYLSPYDETIEQNIGTKREILFAIRKLSDKVGSDKVYWHYSPLFLSDKYTVEFHQKSIKSLCRALKGKCKSVIIDALKPTYKTQVDFKLIDGQEYARFIFSLINIVTAEGFDVIVNFDDQSDKRGYFVDMIYETYGIDTSKKAYIDLGMDDACCGNCLYCSKRDNFKAEKILSTHNPNNLKLDGSSKLLPRKSKTKTKYNSKNQYQLSM